jgi:hypothetical protein
MKRREYTSSDDEYTYDSSDDECGEIGDQDLADGDIARTRQTGSALLTLVTCDKARDDRPCVLKPGTPTPDMFDYKPQYPQADFAGGGSLVSGVSPYGATLATLEFNLKHAIEKRDETRTAACLTELFRHFVLLNMPLQRFVSSNVERQLRLDMVMAVGPFANPAALGMHQRLFVTLVGICVRQVGVASPCALSFVMDQWKAYERVMFYLPHAALARLLSIGATLCSCRKDASVAYTRYVFEDNAKMRDWRAQALKHADVLATYIPEADAAMKARRMLMNNKVYFTNRLRLRKYQAVCIGNPHPEYMCQGGCMARAQVFKLVNTIKQSVPVEAGPEALSVFQDAEDAMVVLGSQVNNCYDREAFETLQVDLQIFLYLLQRVLVSEDRHTLHGPDALMYTSRAMIVGAPRYVTEAFAWRMWACSPDMADLIRYGVVGDPSILKSGSAPLKKKGITPADLLETLHPVVVSRAQALLPPSVTKDDLQIVREIPSSEMQRHLAAGGLRFIFGMYRLHHMWSKCTSAKIAAKGEADRVTVDREFFDIRQGVKVLYRDKGLGILAAEVTLRNLAVAEIAMAAKNGILPGVAGKAAKDAASKKEVLQTTDPGEADIVADHLCRADDAEVRKLVKAVMIGPFDPKDTGKLEREIMCFHEMKVAVGVEPDVVFVKRMMLVDYAGLVEGRGQVLGNVFAWVVYIPCLVADSSHVVMTIDELKGMARQDTYLHKLATSILRPRSLVRIIAVLKRTCGDSCSWKIGHNYVSFRVAAKNTAVVLDHIRLHTITETLLGRLPGKGEVSTLDLVRNIVRKCRTDSSYAGANVDLAKCENILNQL